MLSWTVLVMLFFCANIFLEYLYLYFLDPEIDYDLRDITKVFTYIELCQVLALMIMIVCQSTSIIRKMNALDSVPIEEKTRLKRIMVAFGVGYFCDSIYLVFDVFDLYGCDYSHMCTSFAGLLLIYGNFLFFDVVPMAILYYQHSQLVRSTQKGHEIA